jgi:hypothetical protein
MICRLFSNHFEGPRSKNGYTRPAPLHSSCCAETELMEMIERADTDNDGEVTPDDFFNVSTSLRAGVLLNKRSFVTWHAADNDQKDVHMNCFPARRISRVCPNFEICFGHVMPFSVATERGKREYGPDVIARGCMYGW